MHEKRALVVSGHVLFREGISNLLERAGYTASAVGRLSQLRSREASALVLDLDAPVDDGWVVLGTAREQFPDATIVVVGRPLRIAAAANGYADVELESSRADVPALLAGLRRRAPAASPELARKHKLWAQITPRQREVLGWLSAGTDNPRIAQRLRISDRAVKAHVSALLEHFDLESRAQLALVASDAGLRPPGAR